MLRPARASDFEHVFHIYMDASVNPFMSWEPMPASEFSSIFAEILSGNALWVDEIDARVAAVIRLEQRGHRLSHVAYVGGFGVHPDFQGRGFGKRIMQDAIAILGAKGVKRIELIVESDNAKAIRLYEGLGFQVEGSLKKFFKRQAESFFIDDYYMALLLE